MTREQFVSLNPIEQVMRSRGVKLVGNGDQLKARCPFHDDKKPSFGVQVSKGVWYCQVCAIGGSVIDFIAKHEGISIAEVLKRSGVEKNGQAKEQPMPAVKPEISKIYSYEDALGKERFQVVRFVPKDFRQRHRGADGEWVWNMDGVERMLYRLPEVVKSQSCWLVEGEKDADNLADLGFCATCNVGGAKKWLDGYTEALVGKDVIICGDNDEAGMQHSKMIFDSVAGKARTVRMVKIPSQFKDVSVYIEYLKDKAESKRALEDLRDAAHPFIQGVKLPIFSVAELEANYQKHVRLLHETSFSLGKWLPSFEGKVRSLVPGELVTILGDTGAGKTGLLSHIAMAALPLPTLLFELELPPELLFERFVASHRQLPCRTVEQSYRDGESLGAEALQRHFKNLFICSEAKLSVEDLENYILRSELKLGQRPKVVLVDYIQLVRSGRGGGDRYESTSDTAEGLKVLAKSTRTIIVMASQVSRPKDAEPEIRLHSGKDSGSIENSSGLVIGAWRDSHDATLLHLKVLKNTRGRSGLHVHCNFHGDMMRITERARTSERATGLPFADYA